MTMVQAVVTDGRGERERESRRSLVVGGNYMRDLIAKFLVSVGWGLEGRH